MQFYSLFFYDLQQIKLLSIQCIDSIGFTLIKLFSFITCTTTADEKDFKGIVVDGRLNYNTQI